ncbi:hypothetical protein BH09PAT4_BH09PAT4_04380 [soil metagenome]
MAKVLLVEDDNNLREIYEARLAAEGYEISSAQDGEEALVVAKQAKPDLVISDVMMPKISGFEMLDILRNTAGLERVKVIMLTALGQSEDRDRADSLGADKYLVKSQVTLEDIVKTAHELLGDATTTAAPTSDDDSTTATSQATDAPVATEDIPMAAAPEIEPAPEPIVAAETPVANAPVEPATTSTPPPATNDQSDTPVAADPQPPTGGVAQEENLVTSQIDSFVNSLPSDAGAPTDAQPDTATSPPELTPPAPAEQPTVTAAAPEVTTEPEIVAPTAEEAAATTADDQIMANAVNELAGENTDQPAEPAAVIAPEPVAVPQASPETSPSTAQAEADKTNISINGKKTIQPLDSQPKADIHELLAREEATNDYPATPAPQTEAQLGNTQTPSVVHEPGQSFAPQPPAEESAPVTTPDEDQPSGGPQPTPSQREGIDPNSIAL